MRERRRSIACYLWSSLYSWHMAYLRSSLHSWHMAYLGSALHSWHVAYLGGSLHQWHMACRRLSKFQGRKGNNGARPRVLVYAGLRAVIIPCQQCALLLLFLFRPLKSESRIGIWRAGRRACKGRRGEAIEKRGRGR